MKKKLLLIGLIGMAFGATAQTTVQGIPYSNPAVKIASVTPTTLSTDGTVTFDDIQNWSGEGENQAAFVVQWNDGKEEYAYVYGYRWTGTAYGVDMVRTIVANNPNLYCLIQYTTDALGYTICGIGYDADEDDEIALKDTADGNIYTSDDGVFVHPRIADYDYDNWVAVDTDDHWAAGWYDNGYWSYWVKDSQDASFGYSGLGASSRELVDGSWDGWNFALGFSSYAWLTFAPAPALTPDDAVTEFKIDDIYYTLDSYSKKTVLVAAPMEIEGMALSSYTGNISIPASFEYEGVEYTVVGVADDAFNGAQIESITLPETAVKIGKRAFMNSTCSAINVNFDNLKKLGEYAFYGCSNITTFAIPSTFTSIPAGLYGGTSVTSVEIPASVTSIGEKAFENCSLLESLTLGASLETIGASAFSGCTKLSELTIPNSVSTIESCAFAGCDGLTKVSTDNISPLAITDDVFSENAYANATLFVMLDFKDVYAAADGWKNFINITEVAGEVNVGDYFYKNGVAYVVTAIDDTAKTVKVVHFAVDGEESNSTIKAANLVGYVGDVVVPAVVSYQNISFDVADMDAKTFYGAAEMTSIVFNNNMTRLPDYALNSCTKLASVQFPSTMTEIGDWAFQSCTALTSIDLLNVKVIGSRAFYGCKGLASVELRSDLESLGTYAFNGCISLKSFDFPATITAIPTYVLSGCTGLESVTYSDKV